MQTKRLSLFMMIVLTMALFGCGKIEKKEESQKETSKKVKLEKLTVVLDWVPNTNHTGLYVAKEKGFYEDVGLEVEFVQSYESGSVDVVAAKKAEFGISYQEQVTFARTNENPLPVVAIAALIQNNTSGFASPKDKNILRAKDFENKVYGGWGTPVEETMLKVLMENEGADFQKLKIVDMGANDFFTSVSKDVDFSWIYYGWDGIASTIREFPINFIRLNEIDERLNYYTPIIISSESYLKDNSNKTKRFLSATRLGYIFSVESPEEAVKMLLKNSPEIDPKIAIESQKYLASEYMKGAPYWGHMKESVWDNYASWLYENKLLRNKLIANEAFTNEYLQASE